MHQTAVRACVIILIGAFAACGSSPEPPAAGGGTPQQSRTAPAPEPSAAGPINFASGFYAAERNDRDSWRWMGPEGIVRLKNYHRDMVLKINANLPSQTTGDGKISLELNGAPLDEVIGRSIAKGFSIASTRQGEGEWVELRVRSSTSFVPKELDPASTDKRRLGLLLRELAWEPK
jgi:hypothetical protein